MSITYAVGQRFTATLLQTLADYTVNKPFVRLVQQTAQALADNTDVAVTYGLGSTVFDTHTYHSETVNTTRITPLIAGIYAMRVVGFFETETTPVLATSYVRQNGVTNLPAAARAATASLGLQSFTLGTYTEASFNGSTDYVEHMMLQDSAGADNTNSSGHFRCSFALEFIRPS